MTSEQSPKSIAGHSAFMRRMARVLVNDPNRADDIVQDAWMAAIKTNDPEVLSRPNSWFRTVLSRRAKRVVLDEDLRRRREQNAARPDSVASFVQSSLQKESLEKLSNAVLSLSSQHYEAIVLKFYEALKIRDIAQRLDISEAATKKRIQRAVEELRRILDRDHGGDRSQWLLGLAPLVGPQLPAGSLIGHVLVKNQITRGVWLVASQTTTKVMAIAIVALVFLAGGYFVLEESNSSEIDQEVASTAQEDEGRGGLTRRVTKGSADLKTTSIEQVGIAKNADGEENATKVDVLETLVRVKDSKSFAVPKATIQILDRKSRKLLVTKEADDQGELRLDLPERALILRAESPLGLRSLEYKQEGFAATISLIVHPVAILRGQVLGPEDKPEAEAQVELRLLGQKDASAKRITLDKDAKFVARIPIPDGTLGVWARAKKGAKKSEFQILNLDAGLEYDLVLRIPGGLLIKGVVRDPQGSVLADATVVVKPNSKDFDGLTDLMRLAKKSVTTNELGEFEFVASEYGRYSLYASHGEFAPSVSSDVELSVNQKKVALELTTKEAAWISGRILFDDGEAVEGAIVRAKEAKLKKSELREMTEKLGAKEAIVKLMNRRLGKAFNAKSDKEGRFRLGPIDLGLSYDLEWQENDLAGAAIGKKARIKVAQDQELVLQRGQKNGLVHLEITDSRTGETINNCQVRVEYEASQNLWLQISNSQRQSESIVATSAQHQQSIAGLKDKKWHRLLCRAPGYPDQYSQVFKKPETEAKLVVQLKRGGALEIQLLNSQGKAIDSLALALVHEAGKAATIKVKSSRLGRIERRNLLPGVWQLVAGPKKQVIALINVQLGKTAPQTVVVR